MALYAGTTNIAARITVVDSNRQPIDLSLATSVRVVMKISDDIRSFESSWHFVTDGSDGVVLVPLEDLILASVRMIYLQVIAEFPIVGVSVVDRKFGSIVAIQVKKPLSS